jgi:hypothetical protein
MGGPAVTTRRDQDALPVAAFVLGLGLVAAFVALYATPLGFLDDLTQVRFLFPEAPLDWGWLWHQHNEHRIPLPRLVYTALMLVFRDFRAPTWLDVALLGAIVWTLMEAARRVRGRRSAADAFFPLLWFSLGPAENLLNGFQVVFLLPVGLVALFLAVLAGSARWDRPRTLLVLGACVFALPLCGVPGIVVAVPLALWLALESAAGLRGSDATSRAAGGVALCASLLTVALICSTFLGFRFLPNTREPGLVDVATIGLQALAQVAGWLNGPAWPGSGVLALVLFAAGCAATVPGLRAGGLERRRALGVAAVLAASAGLALAIGFGRGGDQDRAGMLSRYGTLAMLWPSAAWLAVARFGAPGLRERAHALALGLALALWAGNLGGGAEYGRARRDAAEALARDARTGRTWESLAQQHWESFFWSAETFAGALRDLERAGLPPFERPRARLRAPEPFDTFLTAPDQVVHVAPPASRRWGSEKLTAMHPGSSLRFRLSDEVRHFGVRVGIPPYAGLRDPDKPAVMTIRIESADGSKAREVARFEMLAGRGEPPFWGRDYEMELPPVGDRVLVLRVEKDSPRWGAWSYVSLR